MKVLFIITGLGMGGAENVVTSLADALAERNHEVTLVYLTGEAIVLPKNPAIKIIAINMHSAAGFLNAYVKVRRIVKEIRPDIVHSHMVHANLLARTVRLTTKIPKLVCTAHNTDEGGTLRMMAYRLTDRLADLSTNVSNEAVVAFEKKGAVPKNKMLAVSNGIDVTKFSPNASTRANIRGEFNAANKSIFISVGRLFDAKDYPNLLNAFANVVKQKRNIELWIVGDGPLKPVLDNLVLKLGLSNHVIFFGVRRDVPDLMNAADVFVLSSAWEGFGLVVAEAMSTEKIVVATDCGGPKEILGDYGFLVPTRNPEALAKAMSQAMSLPEDEAESLRKNGRIRIVMNYSFEKTLQRWLRIYDAI